MKLFTWPENKSCRREIRLSCLTASSHPRDGFDYHSHASRPFSVGPLMFSSRQHKNHIRSLRWVVYARAAPYKKSASIFRRQSFETPRFLFSVSPAAFPAHNAAASWHAGSLIYIYRGLQQAGRTFRGR